MAQGKKGTGRSSTKRTARTASRSGGTSNEVFPLNKTELKKMASNHMKAWNLLQENDTFIQRINQHAGGTSTGTGTTGRTSSTRRTRVATGRRSNQQQTERQAANA